MKKKGLLTVVIGFLLAFILTGCGNAWRESEPIIGKWEAVRFQSSGEIYTREEFSKALGTDFTCTLEVNADGSVTYTATGINTQYLSWDKADKQEKFDYAYWIGSAPATMDEDDLNTLILYMEGDSEDDYVQYYMEKQE